MRLRPSPVEVLELALSASLLLALACTRSEPARRSLEPLPASSPTSRGTQLQAHIRASERIGRNLRDAHVTTGVKVTAEFLQDCRLATFSLQANDEDGMPTGEARKSLEAKVRLVLDTLGREGCPPDRRFAVSFGAPFLEVQPPAPK
jgi:hypothetical protein